MTPEERIRKANDIVMRGAYRKYLRERGLELGLRGLPVPIGTRERSRVPLEPLRVAPGEAQVAATAVCHAGCGSAAIPGSESAIPSGRVISQTPRRLLNPAAGLRHRTPSPFKSSSRRPRPLRGTRLARYAVTCSNMD